MKKKKTKEGQIVRRKKERKSEEKERSGSIDVRLWGRRVFGAYP